MYDCLIGLVGSISGSSKVLLDFPYRNSKWWSLELSPVDENKLVLYSALAKREFMTIYLCITLRGVWA